MTVVDEVTLLNLVKNYTVEALLKVIAKGLGPDQARHIQAQGAKCPVCQKDNISGDNFDIEEGTVLQEMYCEDCEAEWTDEYHLIRYTRSVVPPEEQ